ncbi:DUF3558 domain-containing protein [Actinokineospora sp. PR83]|uniref:DUF3558 domain-containing protein n=1 Tax=Actinokineospora sp. PR83 TaxID=2884908 RepID=UPI0027E1BCED|nr:DUF3558 family protein [Actinokineospora sp. PR83]MCG8914844.1 DUF3558 domain-containing protein [Actinokineospora sp. PR83]
MKRVLALVVLTVTAIGGVAACAKETTGRAIPSATSPPAEATAPPTESSPSSEPDGAESPAALDPCELLTSSARDALGVTGAAQPDETPSARYCQWALGTGTAAERFTYGVAVFPGLGIDRVVADGEKKPLVVGARKAIESLRSGATCAISIEVTETSRVDVQATGRDGASLCQKVLEAAKLVEPELP